MNKNRLNVAVTNIVWHLKFLEFSFDPDKHLCFKKCLSNTTEVTTKKLNCIIVLFKLYGLGIFFHI